LSLKGKNPVSISFTKGAMTAFNFHYQGKIDEAYRSGKEALNFSEQSGDIYVKGMAFISYGIPCYLKGLLEDAQESLTKGLDLCRKSALIIWGVWANFWLGELLVEKGEYQKAVKYYEQGISFLSKHGEIFPSWARMFKVCIARSKILNKDQDINLNELLDYYSPNKMKILEGFMARYIGEILLSLHAPPLSDIENWINIAIEADRKNSAKWLLGCDYALYAELYKRKNNHPKAKEMLGKAVGILKECAADCWVEKYEKKLTEL
jgi:tetratricopeptide (TPR) repeat protein